MKRALITGIFGQDGSYLTELLAAKNYEVHGIARPQLSTHSQKLRHHLSDKGVTPIVHDCDLNSFAEISELVREVRPDECYHLAAVHHSAQTLTNSLEYDSLQLEQNILSVLNLLHALRESAPQSRFVLAGSCIMFEDSGVSPQNETTTFRSTSPYGTSKIIGQELTELFRARHRLHASVAILYNHESPRREAHFVSQKIVKGLVRVSRGENQSIQLGNLADVKDWGFAGDYVYGMWQMTQADSPADYILATGIAHTVADFVKQAAEILELKTWRELVTVQPGLTRPSTKTQLVGDPRRAQTVLGWRPSVDFRGLIELLVRHELETFADSNV
jgi:GDPmannose 4,6-dehydratase